VLGEVIEQSVTDGGGLFVADALVLPLLDDFGFDDLGGQVWQVAAVLVAVAAVAEPVGVLLAQVSSCPSVGRRQDGDDVCM
jgi:hypothetical protein